MKIYKQILLILLVSGIARADYHYASHEGSNEYPYTSWETAADSIQMAIDAAQAGDTIYVGSGLWEDGPYNLWEDLALIGMGIDSTIIVGFQQGQHLYVNDRTLVQGFNLENCRKAIETHYNDSAIVIRDNKFVGNYMAILGVFTGQVINNIFQDNDVGLDGVSGPCSLLVRNNTFSGCTARGIEGLYGNWTVVNNLFHHNPTIAVGALLLLSVRAPNDTGYAANNLFYHNYEDFNIIDWNLVAGDPKAYFENNTIIGFEEADRFIGIRQSAYEDNPRDLRNNIISGFRSAIRVQPAWPGGYTAVVRLYYNNLWNNLWDNYPLGDSLEYVVGNLSVDPMFEDSTGFRLQMYSPLIDAGDPAILDVDGTRSDMGVYGGPGGENYAYMDLPPAIPDSLDAIVEGDSVILTWRFNTEADFNRYQIFRDTVSGFEPSIFNMIAEPETSLYVDNDIQQTRNYYYRLSAVDNQDNMSGYSEELAVVFTDIGDFVDLNLPRVTAIETNYPNPFNSRTVINYYLADVGYQPAAVKLYIYNIGGQLVRRLVDIRQYPGRYSAMWDGRTDDGENLSSGIYFARLVVSDIALAKPKKIMLLK
jgi:hypothetical protein